MPLSSISRMIHGSNRSVLPPFSIKRTIHGSDRSVLPLSSIRRTIHNSNRSVLPLASIKLTIRGSDRHLNSSWLAMLPSVNTRIFYCHCKAYEDLIFDSHNVFSGEIGSVQHTGGSSPVKWLLLRTIWTAHPPHRTAANRRTSPALHLPIFFTKKTGLLPLTLKP